MTTASASSALGQVRAALQQAGLDALWITQPENVRYISGFSSPEDACVLVTPTRAILYTDARYTVQAAQESSLETHIARPPATYEHAREVLADTKTVGVEAEHLSLGAAQRLKDAWQKELLPTANLIEPLRLTKTQAEVELIRGAQAIADQAFAATLPYIKAGATEVEIAALLEQHMRSLGAEAPAFETIVASGERGALPHGRATDKVIQDGELVTLDFGARKHGYHSDMTRTVAVGPQSAENVRLYRAVLEAQEAAIAAVKAGIKAGDLDKISREVLKKHGLDDYFTHSLGHGVGLNIHEGPGLRAQSEEVLQAGMIITIEPGVYLPGVTGLRIEDLLLVTPTGYEVLSQSPKQQL